MDKSKTAEDLIGCRSEVYQKEKANGSSSVLPITSSNSGDIPHQCHRTNVRECISLQNRINHLRVLSSTQPGNWLRDSQFNYLSHQKLDFSDKFVSKFFPSLTSLSIDQYLNISLFLNIVLSSSHVMTEKTGNTNLNKYITIVLVIAIIAAVGIYVYTNFVKKEPPKSDNTTPPIVEPETPY